MYLPREVCLKHRKIRREISCGCESFTGLAVVFVFIGSLYTLRPSFKSRTPGFQPGDAGAIPAGRISFSTIAE